MELVVHEAVLAGTAGKSLEAQIEEMQENPVGASTEAARENVNQEVSAFALKEAMGLPGRIVDILL